VRIPNIFEVIYSPRKAFKNIADNPSYVGPVLIMIILVIANMGFAYAAMTRTTLEASVPNGQLQDQWTQNSTLWTSNAPSITDSNDSIIGTLYGNASIEFSMTTTVQVWMDLTDIGPVNCSSPGGYDQLSFRLKQVSPQDKPKNASIYLFSSASDYFYYGFIQDYSNSTVGSWYNLTLPLGSGWSESSANADWSNITGFKLQFDWSSNTNVTMLVDGLYFHGVFHTWLDAVGVSYLLSFSFQSLFQFAITWVILSGLLFLLGRALGGKLVWRLILIAVGFILITMVVQAVVNVASYAALFHARYPFIVIGGVGGEGTAEYNAILDQTSLVRSIGTVTQLVIYAWTIVLGAMILRFTAELRWLKSMLASVVAYLVTVLVSSFLFG
jgi:hypothetical protein